jgi:hypothetical protein
LITYTGDLNFNGEDLFEYRMCDLDTLCDQAIVTVTVNPINDPPLAVGDVSTTTEDLEVLIPVSQNDLDVEDELDLDSIKVTVESSNGITSVISPTGVISYMPDLNFYGEDLFRYEICDLEELCSSANVTITILAENDPPIVNNDFATSPEDTEVSIDVVNNDVDVDENLDPTTVEVISPPGSGEVVNPADGTIDYTPQLNFNGLDTFSYQVCDTDLLCGTATVTVTVTPVNDPPLANNDYATTPEDTAVQISVMENDYDVEGRLDGSSLSVVVPPTDGTTSVNFSLGTIIYTPDLNFSGSDSFSYQICDLLLSGAPGACDIAQVSVSVDVVNDPPVAMDDSVSTPEDTPVLIDVLANDTDVDGNIYPGSVNVIAQPVSGTVENHGDGTLTYAPYPEFHGGDSFRYQVCDVIPPGIPGDCDTATVIISINSVNDPPVAHDDRYLAIKNIVLERGVPGVLSNDQDPEGDSITVVLVEGPKVGSLSLQMDGSWQYMTPLNFTGEVTFTYQAYDNDLYSNLAVGTIVINELIVPTIPITWTSPVPSGDVIQVTDQTLTLTVDLREEDCEAPGCHVRYYRWDALETRFVDIGVVSSSPYEWLIDVQDLNLGWNQIFVQAFDSHLNGSARTYIWIYRVKGYYFPVILR